MATKSKSSSASRSGSSSKSSSSSRKSSSRKSSSRSRSSSRPKDSKRLYDNQQGNVHVDSTTRVYLDREAPALIGHFAKVVKGEHQGRYGYVDSVAENGPDGWPKTVVFVTRDDETARLVVKYDELQSDVAGRR